MFCIELQWEKRAALKNKVQSKRVKEFFFFSHPLLSNLRLVANGGKYQVS